MRKTEKIKLLRCTANTYQMCECQFSYDRNNWYLYIVDNSDELLMGIEENEFILNGFRISQIADLKKIKINDSICPKINEENKILEGVAKPSVDISSWQAVFSSLKALNKFVIVENENIPDENDFFYMGYTTEVKDTCILFSAIGADGDWLKDILIFYSDITSVHFDDRYSKNWHEYLLKHDMLKLMSQK